jgi:carboxyl-terminal processing protease
MSLRGKIWVLAISGAIALFAVVGGLPAIGGLLTTQAQQPINDAGAQIRIFESVLQHIQNDYVDEPNMAKVRLGALRGLAGGLDPYSAYLTSDQVQAYKAEKASGKVGVGAEFSEVSAYLYVVSVTKGSPAEKAGLKTGDVVEYVDGKATRDISLFDSKQLIEGDPGTTVSLRVLRSGEKPATIKITRGTFKTPAVESRVEAGKVGVIKIYSLDEGEAGDVRTHVQNLAKQGVQKIVLDLRGLASGTQKEGISVANLFIKQGDLGKVLGRDNKPVKTFPADPANAIFEGKVIAIIDLGTAGPGEVIASAILDQKRGDVVGERSFGAGTEQSLFPLKSGDALLLTTAKWASPNGVAFLGEDRTTTGIKPSVEVKRPDTPEPLAVQDLVDQQNQTPDQANPTQKPEQKTVIEDLQLKKALELLADKTATTKAAAAGE